MNIEYRQDNKSKIQVAKNIMVHKRLKLQALHSDHTFFKSKKDVKKMLVTIKHAKRKETQIPEQSETNIIYKRKNKRTGIKKL